MIFIFAKEPSIAARAGLAAGLEAHEFQALDDPMQLAGREGGHVVMIDGWQCHQQAEALALVLAARSFTEWTALDLFDGKVPRWS